MMYLYYVKICFDAVVDMNNNMKKDIAKLQSKVEINKKEIIGIRNDMCDYFNIDTYGIDDAFLQEE